MKNRRIEKEDYKQLTFKIFYQTVLLGITAFILIIGIYMLFLRGRVADWLVSIFQFFLGNNYEFALDIYHRFIRSNLNYFFIAAIIIVFLGIFLIYLNWFTKYFYEINRGIDELVKENGGEIVLLPELSATQKKLNSVRQTLEKQKLETQLAEQRKNDLVVYLAHDLKTPLTSVIGYLTLMNDENNMSQEMREKYLSISLSKAERLEDLINEFFEITRFSLTDITLELSKVNLTRMLEQLIYEFKPNLSDKKLICKLNSAPDIMIKCDIDKMQRVFDNLLNNAVNYSFEESVIEISVSSMDEEVKISFTNRGNTIPNEKLARIFEQFYRLDASRTTKSGGAGLGLAIAKQIVELHKGTITAIGSDEIITFEVTIPAL